MRLFGNSFMKIVKFLPFIFSSLYSQQNLEYNYVYCDNYDTIQVYKNDMYYLLENNIWGKDKSDDFYIF